jgi:hypothetical protein
VPNALIPAEITGLWPAKFGDCLKIDSGCNLWTVEGHPIEEVTAAFVAALATDAGTRFALEPILGTLQLPVWSWIFVPEESPHVCRHRSNSHGEALGFRDGRLDKSRSQRALGRSWSDCEGR